jgi:GDPmannose 4,6-dehydratase
MLQTDKPDDYVLATNETHSIRQFVEETFRVLGEEIEWKGNGINEKGIMKSSGKEVVAIDPRYFRPTEVDLLIGDASKAHKQLGWKPKVTFRDLVRIMTEADFEKAKRRLE